MNEFETYVFGENPDLSSMNEKFQKFIELKNQSSEDSYVLQYAYSRLVRKSNTISELQLLKDTVWGDKRFTKVKLRKRLNFRKWTMNIEFNEETTLFLQDLLNEHHIIPSIVESIEIEEEEEYDLDQPGLIEINILNSILANVKREEATALDPDDYTIAAIVVEDNYITGLYLKEVDTIPNSIQHLTELKVLSMPSANHFPGQLLGMEIPRVHLAYRLSKKERSRFSDKMRFYWYQTTAEWEEDVLSQQISISAKYRNGWDDLHWCYD